ncbi:MAG TPA: tyrosine--tRNA ligase [Alphaproteobacteria bacterium]|nr:tyrosine--tRNA ligase [Alphaproteobacteria bacterium]
MTQPRSDFIRVLSERGYIHQCTDLDGLDRKAAGGGLVAYVGYDCTADSLHIGHLVSIMMLRWLQQTGGRPIALMGGGTTKVGDPSGKDEARKLLSEETIAANKAAIQKTFANFLAFDGGANAAIMVDNAEWLDQLRYIPFLREVGRHFSVNRMLTMDSVRLRLERDQPLSFLEFNYMILQSYDFVELAKRYGCRLQMGGSDQWGNIVMGAELGRRTGDFELFGLTTPLITTASGAKMGKTAQGAVWLNPDRLPPYDYFQFWRNTEDADVGRFLCLFTDLPLDEIARLEKLQGAEINEAKKVLAFEATKLCHGEAAASAAAETARKTFEEGSAGSDLPSVPVTMEALQAGLPLFRLMVQVGVSASNGEARRLIEQGGARVNDVVVKDVAFMVRPEHLNGDVIKLSAGRKKHGLARLAK